MAIRSFINELMLLLAVAMALAPCARAETECDALSGAVIAGAGLRRADCR